MGDETVVFEGTPLASYLADHGNNEADDDDDLSGWGIEPPVQPGRSRQFNGSALVPLMLNAESGRAIIRRKKFKQLVTNALKTRLDEAENLQFLERFRYVLVSSDLLDGRVSAHTAAATNNNNNFEELERYNVLFGADGPWSVLRMHDRYWIGGGGVIVVIATLVTWGVTRRRRNSTATLVVVLCISLYLFAHSRRKTLRMLRAKAVSYGSLFIKSNQQFDTAVTKCVSLITEVDLMIQGYKVSASSLKNRVTNETRMTGKHLRAGLSASLYLAMNAYLDAVTQLLDKCCHLDLMRYLDIYNVRVEELGLCRREDRLEGSLIALHKSMYYGPDGANASLNKLKQEFSRLHLLRRTLMCILLSISSQGECTGSELDAWGSATFHLKTLGELLQQLTKAVSTNTKKRTDITNDNTITNTNPAATDYRGHSRALNDISSTLQHVEARLQVLGDETMMVDNSDYTHHYQLVGEEIRHMLDSWERGWKDINLPTGPGIVEALEVDEEDDEWKRPFSPTSPVISSFPSSAAQSLHRRTDTCSTNSSAVTLIQGIAEEDLKRRSSLSRQERIKMMHQQRDLEKERRSEQKEKASFVNELDTVLKRRGVN